MSHTKRNTVSSLNTRKRHPLDKLLKANDLTILDVCRVIGMSRKTFERIKLDYVTYLSVSTAYKLAGILNITVPTLFYCLERSKVYKEEDVVLSSLSRVIVKE